MVFLRVIPIKYALINTTNNLSPLAGRNNILGNLLTEVAVEDLWSNIAMVLPFPYIRHLLLTFFNKRQIYGKGSTMAIMLDHRPPVWLEITIGKC